MNKTYQEYLRSDDWLTKRYLKRMKRNNCAICNSRHRLEVHHLNYRNLVDVEMSDLRVLCHRCHFLGHDLHRAGKFKFKNDNHNSRFAIFKHAVKKELNVTKENLFQ